MKIIIVPSLTYFIWKEQMISGRKKLLLYTQWDGLAGRGFAANTRESSSISGCHTVEGEN